MKTYALIALIILGALGHADPVKNELTLDHVRTTASGGFEIAVSYKLQKAVLKAEKLEPGQPVTLQDDGFFVTVRSSKALAVRDNVVTVQLSAKGHLGVNGSPLTGLFILEMQQGNEYGISNPEQKPIFDSTANIERDLKFFLLGMTESTLTACSEVDALRMLVAYQRKFPNRLLRAAMNDVEHNKFKKASGGGLCATLPESETEVDISLREPALPTPKKAPAPGASATPEADAATPAQAAKKGTRNRFQLRNGKMIDTTTGRPVAPVLESENPTEDDQGEVNPPPHPSAGRATRPSQAPAPRRQRLDPYDRGGYGQYGDPYGRGNYGERGGYGGYGGQPGYGGGYGY